MSPEAIDLRIRELSQLWKLAMSLAEARRLGRVVDIETTRPPAAALPAATASEAGSRSPAP
jgi:hypothetical protein